MDLKYLYGVLFYAALGCVSLTTVLITKAEIGLAYVSIGALLGAGFITVRRLLTGYPVLRRGFVLVASVLLLVFAIQNVTGKLAVVTGVCFSIAAVSYYLEHSQ
jgi:hypothetical protein